MLIYNTNYGTSIALAKQAVRAYPYLVTNRAVITPAPEEMTAIAGMRSFVRSTIVDLFKRIVDEGVLDQFAIMNLALANKDIPDILTMDELSIDGKYLEGVPAGYDKPWINLTPLLAKRRTKSDPFTIVDIPRACGYFVRANLCAGYHDKATSGTDAWLSPSLEIFVIESYSMTATLLLQRVYNLDINEARMIQTLFAYHYAKLLSARTVEGGAPAILGRCTFLGSMSDINSVVELANEAAGGKLAQTTFFELCDIIRKIGPPRMASFEPVIFIRLFSASPTDSQSMAIALDYPPYWVFQLLRYLSGAKNYVIGQTMNLQIIKRESIKFEQSILTQRGLIHHR